MLYFAYGMNTNSQVMSDTNKRLGLAYLLDYKWELLQYANVYKCPGSSVAGILWEIDELELMRLDIREGYPSFYDRVETTVVHNNESKTAIVYYMTDFYRQELAQNRPSLSYYNGIVDGFAEDGLLLHEKADISTIINS